MGKLSSQFNPCLNTCLEASWCTVFPQQAAAAASACSLHDTAVGLGLVTQAPAAPEVKQQLCSLWGKRLSSSLAGEDDSSSLPHCPDPVPLILWVCKGSAPGSTLSLQWLSPSMTPGQRATLQLPPPSWEQGTTGREWIRFCTKNHCCEWVAWNYHLGARPCCAVQQNICVALGRHRGMCCSFHVK